MNVAPPAFSRGFAPSVLLAVFVFFGVVLAAPSLFSAFRPHPAAASSVIAHRPVNSWRNMSVSPKSRICVLLFPVILESPSDIGIRFIQFGLNLHFSFTNAPFGLLQQRYVALADLLALVSNL